MNGYEKYPHLLEPLKINKTIYRNRIFTAPTGLLDMSYDCVPTEDFIEYFVRKAKGGAGCVDIGECHIDAPPDPESRYRVFQLKDHVRNYNSLGKLANNISRYGAVPTMEILKSGYIVDDDGVKNMLGPSEGPNPRDPRGWMKPVDEEYILKAIDDYSEAALYAKNRGYGMVTVHGGHGWFIHRFFSPYFNKRTDRWGGSIENRARFAVAVCDDIHRKCGKDFPVEIRISGSEMLEGGFDQADGIEFAKQLDGHADLIHVSMGCVFFPETEQYTHPGIFKESACNVKYAAEIKKHVHVPVATVGGLSDPDEAEEIIASGKADVVIMARGLICDPDLPIKISTGREKEVRKCLRCFRCVREMYQHGRLFCALNPESGKEREVNNLRPIKEQKTVLVAGGGIAGMEAAIAASDRGHKVILCEKTDSLGGILQCESRVHFKKRVDEYIERQKYMIGKADIDVRLNTEVTPQLVSAMQPDALICAIGGKVSMPPIPGIDGKNVLPVDVAFATAEKLEGKTVVLGAGLSGLELAIHLAMLGKDVEVVEKADEELGKRSPGQMVEMQKYGKKVTFNREVLRITEEGVWCKSENGEELFKADNVVAALGMVPLWDEVETLRHTAGEFWQVGDCRTPRDIVAATGEGWTAAVNIGQF